MMTSRKTPQASNKSKSTSHRGSLTKFARSLLDEWRKLGLPLSNATIVVAVSGGADSVALLLAINELIRAKKLTLTIVVAHFNHKLRGAAGDADARWVKSLVRQLTYRIAAGSADVKSRARKQKENVEQAARKARYDFLARAARSHKSRAVLTAHTMNDQVETVLLNFMRGAGLDGLTGMDAVRPLTIASETILARPLLCWARRQDTRNYCATKSVEYREDQMNFDEAFSRVRVRNQLVPLMESFNTRLIDNVARSAEILRQDNLALEGAAARLLELSSTPKESRQNSNHLRLDLIKLAPVALRRRALRLWLMRHRGSLTRIDLAHIAAIEKLLVSTKSGRIIELPGGATVIRKGGFLQFCASERGRP
jgi:tRNA(Ile)-lysidine synthase